MVFNENEPHPWLNQTGVPLLGGFNPQILNGMSCSQLAGQYNVAKSQLAEYSGIVLSTNPTIEILQMEIGQYKNYATALSNLNMVLQVLYNKKCNCAPAGVSAINNASKI